MLKSSPMDLKNLAAKDAKIKEKNVVSNFISGNSTLFSKIYGNTVQNITIAKITLKYKTNLLALSITKYFSKLCHT